MIGVFRNHREKFLLVGYFVVMLGLTLPLSSMFAEAYEGGNLTRALFDFHLLVDVIDLEGVSMFFLGIFIGLLVLLTIDPKKRWQGYLLWLGLGISLLGLQARGLFFPNIEVFDTANLAWFGIGTFLGLLGGGGRKLFRTQTAEALEFRRAAVGIYLIVSLLVIASLLETHLTYPELLEVTAEEVLVSTDTEPGITFESEGFLMNAALSSVFIVTIRQFMKYDAEEKFFVLGPAGSGKSQFFVGAFLSALNRGESDNVANQTPLQPSQDLMDTVQQLNERAGWLPSTGQGDLKDLEFQYVHGSIFPKIVKISSVDYAGEYLDRLPDILTGAVSEDEEENALLRLSQGVKSADTLILLVDLKRFANDDESLDIAEYFSILQALNDKNVVIIATKADVLADDFKRDHGIEPHLDFDEFKQYIENQLRQNEQITALIRQTVGAEIHPVYYQTKESESGERVPMRDESGSVMTIGYEQLLNKLGE